MANTINIEKYLQELKEYYEKLVRNNPDTVAQIESATRILSFLIAGRFDNGPVISELIYSASNLLVFVHDNIYKNAVKCLPKLEASVERLQLFLTILEYTEVFLEMAALKRWGRYTAWVVITIIQLAKTVLRFVLLINKKSGIQMNPIVPPADRELLKSSVNLEHDNLEDAWEEENMRNDKEETFTLSTGRQIRTLKSAKRSGLRTWNGPITEGPEGLASEASRKKRLLLQKSTKLDSKRLWGECLHIARPMAHLMSMYLFGQNSWKPWLVASGLDVSSLYLMGDTKDLSKREQSEMRRRNILLLYYLLRSPFYDKYTKNEGFMKKVTYILTAAFLLYILRPVNKLYTIWTGTTYGLSTLLAENVLLCVGLIVGCVMCTTTLLQIIGVTAFQNTKYLSMSNPV